MKLDLTILAIPGFVGAMVAEHAWQRRHPAAPGESRPGDYEAKDTLASLTMGLGSLLAPAVARRVLEPVTPGVGRYGRALLALAAAAGLATTVGDVLLRRYAAGSLPEPGALPPELRHGADVRQGRTYSCASDEKLRHGAVLRRGRAGAGAGADEGAGAISGPGAAAAAVGATAVAAVGATALAAATSWATLTGGCRLFDTHQRDLGGGLGATLLAVLGWDAIYYWNHRLSHESRWLWAVHVVHHSSERYNLSTALRQPVAEGVTMAVPYGLLSLLGVRPSLVEQARALNLIYQFWIHTEVIRSLGPLEKVLNTPSHHRVHHGSNRRYLDRNHGSILIVWDRLFGTFEPEGEPVVYGLTRTIGSFSPMRIATHEWRDIAQDVAGARTWHDRFSFLLRGPGWAYSRRA